MLMRMREGGVARTLCLGRREGMRVKLGTGMGIGVHGSMVWV